MFRKLTIITIFISVYVEGLLVAHAQDLGFIPGSLFVLMSILALTTLVGSSVYFRMDEVVYVPIDTNKKVALTGRAVYEQAREEDVDVEVEKPEPFTYTDAIEIGLVEEYEVVDVEVVEDTDFTDTVVFKLPEIDIEEADKELQEALNEEMSVEPPWTKERKEATTETDKMIDDLFGDVDDDGSPKLDPDVKVQSYALEESVIEDEYIPIPEEDEAESIDLDDLIKTVSEGLDVDDTAKVNVVMADGNSSITLEELSETAAEGLDVEDVDPNLVDDDAYDKTIAVEVERSM